MNFTILVEGLKDTKIMHHGDSFISVEEEKIFETFAAFLAFLGGSPKRPRGGKLIKFFIPLILEMIQTKTDNDWL